MTQDVWCVLATRGFHRLGFHLEMAGLLNAVNYPTKPDRGHQKSAQPNFLVDARIHSSTRAICITSHFLSNSKQTARYIPADLISVRLSLIPPSRHYRRLSPLHSNKTGQESIESVDMTPYLWGKVFLF